MRLVGSTGTNFPKNDFFKDVLYVVAKTPLSDGEVAIFGLVLEVLQGKCIQEGIKREDLGYVSVIISDDGSYAFEADENDEEAYGHYTQNIIYPMNNIRRKPDPRFMAMAFTEELVHFIWPKLSEKEVKYQVIEILKPIIGDIDSKMMRSFGIIMEDY
mgnify:CR=1 FL=1|nr:MAG TPA: hypothetical protein [Caudoviricetes sp.]